MILILAKEKGRPLAPQAFEDTDGWVPERGVEYTMMVQKDTSLLFIISTIRKLVEAGVEFAVWEFHEPDSIEPTGTTKLW